MIIMVYDKNLDMQGVVDVYKSLIWTRKFYDMGTFELIVPVSQNNVQLLLLDGFIIKKDDDDEVACINYRKMSRNEQGEYIKVSGSLYSGLLNQRVMYTIEQNLKSAIESNLRNIPMIIDSSVSNVIYKDDLNSTQSMIDAVQTKFKMEPINNSSLEKTKNLMTGISTVLSSGIELQPKIKPILDISDIERGASTISDTLSKKRNVVIDTSAASTFVSKIDPMKSEKSISSTSEIVKESMFIQNNYSPKALSEYEIYRNMQQML